MSELTAEVTRVKFPDLVLALITRYTPKEPFTKRLNDMMEELSESGYDVDPYP